MQTLIPDKPTESRLPVLIELHTQLDSLFAEGKLEEHVLQKKKSSPSGTANPVARKWWSISEPNLNLNCFQTTWKHKVCRVKSSRRQLYIKVHPYQHNIKWVAKYTRINSLGSSLLHLQVCPKAISNRRNKTEKPIRSAVLCTHCWLFARREDVYVLPADTHDPVQNQNLSTATEFTCTKRHSANNIYIFMCQIILKLAFIGLPWRLTVRLHNKKRQQIEIRQANETGN